MKTRQVLELTASFFFMLKSPFLIPSGGGKTKILLWCNACYIGFLPFIKE